MFINTSPVQIQRIIVAVTLSLAVLALIGGVAGAYWLGKSAGKTEAQAAQLAASLAAEISLSKRQKSALNAASKENQKLVADLWREMTAFSSRVASLRSEVRNLPRIEEFNCAPGTGRVDVVNRTLAE